MANTEEIGILIKAQEQTTAAFTAARGELQKLGQQGQQTNKLLGGLTSGLGALGVAFSATAVIGFAKDILDTAGNINDLSQAMGVSTDAVQDFKAVAEASGATIDNVADAINKLNVEAGNGAGGFEKLHLNLSEIQALSPEDRFREVANALQAIQDPAERAALGQELLGKGYKNLAASIDQGIGSMRDANKMTKETIDTLDWLGDELLSVATKAKNFAGEALAKAISTPRDVLREMTADLDRLGIAIDAVAAKAPKIPDAFKGLSRDAVTPKGLGAEEAAQIEDALNRERKALDETAKADDAHAQKVKALSDAIFGRTAIAAANDYLQALGSVNNLSKLSTEEQKKLNTAALEAIEAYDRLGEVAPAALNQVYVLTARLPEATRGIVDVVKDLGREAEVTIPILYDLPKPVALTSDELELLGRKSSLTLKDLIPAGAKQSTSSFREMQRALADLGNEAGGAFGQIVRDLEQLSAAEVQGAKGVSELGTGIAELGDGSPKGILDVVTGITDITSAAIKAGKAVKDLFSKLFDRDQGRDLVVNFADTLGGFDALHQQLLQLGDEGEQLWIKLTQGVGRNNPKEAQAAIDEVTKALDEQKDKQGQVTGVTEDAALATIETATQASQALDVVNQKLGESESAWHDWSASVMNDIAKVAAAVGGIGVPSPGASPAVPGFAGGTHGAYLDFGAGTPVMLHGRERVMTEAEGRGNGGTFVGTTIVQVDGREIARASTRYQKSVLAPYGVR
jgi:hypothetical protein